MNAPIVQTRQFIQAIRDAGYKSTSSALAELVDNSFEANASTVMINLVDQEGEIQVSVSDDGCGMTPAVLRAALQFGGSSRFASREGTGRYGMGLPNSSVSQARHFDVYTWNRAGRPLWSYLDIDEIISGELSTVPEPQRMPLPSSLPRLSGMSGTVVVWSKCDRLSLRRITSLVKNLHADMGRIFRVHLWEGRKIFINDEEVQAFDPLFVNEKSSNLIGATQYGPTLRYAVKIPEAKGDISEISVRFSELPIKKWVGFSNADKRKSGISKQAGVSVLRAGREIDFGWHLMGGKRKENYDDWWRCEIRFGPELDELFGVTHTKQGVNPSEELELILAADMEKIAHELNSRVRDTFIELRKNEASASERHAAGCEVLFEPIKKLEQDGLRQSLQFRVDVDELPGEFFYDWELDGGQLRIVLNRKHPFTSQFYSKLSSGKYLRGQDVQRIMDLNLIALARAELDVKNGNRNPSFRKIKLNWSNLLAAYLR